MKKSFAFLTILALLLPVLAGCQSAPPPASGNNSSTTVPTTQATLPGSEIPAATQAVSRITPEEAVDIALKDAGLERDAVRDLHVELDRETAGTHYNVDFESGGHDYEYEIDALSGKILQARKERD